jgi:MinD superfamily P-loop ATPase
MVLVKRIAVTGGKGGTGKSLVATALAVELAKSGKVLLADMDVDCPDDHLLLSINLKKEKELMIKVPAGVSDKCIKCGKCANVCRENAILFHKEKGPTFIIDECIGCTACMIGCPVNAIGSREVSTGSVYSGSGSGIDMVSGKLKAGKKESSPVVNGVNEYIKEKAGQYDYIIVDTAAGTHCSVISALRGCDLALAVTEPTPMGAHDLELILCLLEELKIPARGIVNKSGIGKRELAEEVFAKKGVGIITDIPYSEDTARMYSQGVPALTPEIMELARALRRELQ